MYAKRDIEVGEELHFNYGKLYHEYLVSNDNIATEAEPTSLVRNQALVQEFIEPDVSDDDSDAASYSKRKPQKNKGKGKRVSFLKEAGGAPFGEGTSASRKQSNGSKGRAVKTGGRRKPSQSKIASTKSSAMDRSVRTEDMPADSIEYIPSDNPSEEAEEDGDMTDEEVEDEEPASNNAIPRRKKEKKSMAARTWRKSVSGDANTRVERGPVEVKIKGPSPWQVARAEMESDKDDDEPVPFRGKRKRGRPKRLLGDDEAWD